MRRGAEYVIYENATVTVCHFGLKHKCMAVDVSSLRIVAVGVKYRPCGMHQHMYKWILAFTIYWNQESGAPVVESECEVTRLAVCITRNLVKINCLVNVRRSRRCRVVYRRRGGGRLAGGNCGGKL